tara:strand:- start:1882 stop:2340 length:459 start_codon:yes stop_codon:yes gene_type:complete
MANPMYGQNKFDSALSDSPRLIVGPEFGFGDDDAAVENGSILNNSRVAIPAGTLVERVAVLVTTVGAGGTAGTTDINIGYDGDDDFFLSDVDHNTGYLGTVDNVLFQGNDDTDHQTAKYFSSANVIQAKVIAKSATSGKARLLVWTSDLAAV